MAEEGLNPWCDEHWSRIREDPHYNGIAAAVRLVELAMDEEDFEEVTVAEYDGSVQDAMADLSPLCCWMEDRDALEQVYEDVRMDEPTDVDIDTSHETESA